jgi:hypothetical protein
MRAVLRENQTAPFFGVVDAGRRGLYWHRRWSLLERLVPWSDVRTCSAGPDRRLGVARHTQRLVVEHADGMLEVILFGPWGAIALADLRDRIRAAADLSGALESREV